MAHAALRGNGGDLQDCDPVRPQYVDRSHADCLFGPTRLHWVAKQLEALYGRRSP
jgi:hypothetical protein